MNILIGLGMYIVNNATELIGFAMPPVVDYLARDVNDENERLLVAGMVCFVAAILTKWHYIVVGSPEEVMATAGIIFAESHFMFKLYFRNSFLRTKLQETLYDKDVRDDKKSNAALPPDGVK